jgi:hypothetical protein
MAMRATALIRYSCVLVLTAVSVALAQDSSDSSPTVGFEGYQGAPDFQVVPRKEELFFYPCDQCHATMEPNPEIRILDTFHDSEIDHGLGQIWCLSCHALEDYNQLQTLLGHPVDLNDAHLVCGGCHSRKHRDWTFGAHGKRVSNWQGERTLYSCTHCHNPHAPAIEPRAPQPAPPVRARLSRDSALTDAESAEDGSEQEQPEQ